jgi:multiple sugar transport system substrate-binding protein
LFRRAGLDPSRPPATWSALLAAATRIQKLRHGVHGYGLALGDSLESFRDFMPYAWGNGGEILSAGLDSSRFGSERNVAALRFYVSLRRAGLLAGRDTLAREFRAGRLGMLLASGAQVAAASPGPSWATALVPAPAADSAHVSLAGATVLVSFNAARHKEAAQRLARFLTRPRNALALAASAPGAEPAWVGVDTAACYRQHHARAVLLQQVANARFAPGHRDRGAVARAIAIEVEATLRGGKNAERAVADADARLAARTGRK